MPGVLVTGASTGIGEACARHLDRLGHTVFAGVRREADGERLRAGGSDRLVTVLLDVTDEAQVAAAARRVDEGLGRMRLAGIVNNAGVAVGGPIEYLDLEWWRTQLEVNVVGQVAVTRAFLPLIRRGTGRIVFMGSNSGRIATPMMGPYCASKHAIEAVGESLRHELFDWGIAVSVIEPGAVRTAIWDKGRALADRLETELPEEATTRYRRWIDLIRRGIDASDRGGVEPEVVARAVEHALFSARPRARYPVGSDAKVSALASRLLPDPVRDRVVRAMAAKL